MSPVAESVLRRLDAARQKWWLFTLLSTSVLAVCVSFGALLLLAFGGTLLVLAFGEALLKFSQWLLLGLFVLWLTLNGGLVFGVVWRLLRGQRSLEATARRVEWEQPELGSDLINLVQLSEDRRNLHRGFCEAAVHQAAARIGYVSFDAAAAKESRWRRFRYCMQTPRDLLEACVLLAALIVLAVLYGVFVPKWGSAFSQILEPWKFVPSVEIVSVTPGDAEVLVGSSVEIAAEIRNPQAKPYKAVLFVTPDDQQELELPLAPDKQQEHFRLTLPAVLRPLKYRLEIGDAQTKTYRIGVREKPAIREVEVTFHYPAYIGRKDETFTQRHADLEAPQYTLADLKIFATVPLKQGHLQMERDRFTGRVDSAGAALVLERVPLVKDTTFTIHLFNEAGHSDPDPRVNRVRVRPDQPPVVELLKPPRQSSSAPGAGVPVMVRASDDYGIGRVWLEMKIQPAEPQAAGPENPGDGPQGEKPPEVPTTPTIKLEPWPAPEGNPASVVRNHKLELNPEQVKPGQTVLVRAVAADKRWFTERGLELRPQESAGGWHAIRIIAAETQAAAALQQLDNLRASIWKLLEKQIRARMRTASMLTNELLAERTQLAAGVRGEQVEIQKTSEALAQSIGQTDAEDRLPIRRALSKLAFDEMLSAVKHCDGLAKLTSAEAFPQPVGALAATQDQIIEVLRKLLDATRRAESEALSQMQNRPGGDLPDDTKKKFQEARDKLDEFLKQQKKVIEASENLAKMPVEDFTEKEEQKLKEMAAAEDDWSKFMKELQTDLSKLPEQDFANSSMLQELVEIQVELKMAADALLKKSADIAVPLEQLGYERAEEIKTNMEKWLPDTPDREKWSQEESLTDADKEAPMAELPGELEDMIGELMEEEEDLFDEMEDVSSSAADSIDKGAGWDVADGPISNMSAKGATGNRLPNTSEIGGRSGEGRSGKSSGEFVGDEAVGKGGRKTPSRLTPDPYVKGQIKDHSKDPTGGATGGGKESGQGNKGLEGPSPGTPGERDLARLAGKQAALRNKAEGIDLQFQVMNFHHTDLKKLLGLMSQIELDLKAGRYQNVLRERKVLLDGLGNVKQYLEGEFEVRQDATANLPTDIQKEILGSMRDPSPAGWEELNRQYFERLSTSGGGAKPEAELKARER